jgi:hypothetical protein
MHVQAVVYYPKAIEARTKSGWKNFMSFYHNSGLAVAHCAAMGRL